VSSEDNKEVPVVTEEGEKTENVLSSLNKKVAETIAGSTSTVVDSVVDQFVTQEVSRRTTALFNAIVKCNTLRDEFKKFKPDILAYDVNGKVISENWSKTKLDERKKADETLKKAEKAIEKALAGDFSQVLNGGNQ
jgi:hypothetical protein